MDFFWTFKGTAPEPLCIRNENNEMVSRWTGFERDGRLAAEAPAMADALREAVDLLAELRVYETGDAADGELHERMLAILARIDGEA